MVRDQSLEDSIRSPVAFAETVILLHYDVTRSGATMLGRAWQGQPLTDRSTGGGATSLGRAGRYAFSTPSMRPLKNGRWAKANATMPGVTTIVWTAAIRGQAQCPPCRPGGVKLEGG
jgi:hypothetical protein